MTKPTVPEVLKLVNAIYHRKFGGAGCCLHILTDDGNIKDDDAAFCLQYARECGHADCIAAAAALVQMSKTQRHQIYTNSNGRY